jgi:polyisoprenoid-binding protein YceI
MVLVQALSLCKETISMKMVRLAGWAAAMTLAVGAGSLSAQVKDYRIESTHSEADFAVKHLGISTVHGSFHTVTGVVKFDPNNLAASSVDATIAVSGVDTGEPKRDEHLKSDSFFEVSKFPTITFKSTSVKAVGDHYALTGDLTMHGVTKSVVLNLDPPSKEQMGMDKRPHRGFTATTTVNRKDFNLSWTGAAAAADPAIGNDIKIEIDIDAAQQ